MPDTQQEIANSFAAVSAADGDDGMAGPSASAAGKVSSGAAKMNERRRVEKSRREPPVQAGGTASAHNICLSNSSDDALALNGPTFRRA